jgi:hypothetical protein
MIGDVIKYRIHPTGTVNNIIIFPQISETESMEIRDQILIEDRGKVIGKEFTIVFWDTGRFYVPELEITVLENDSTYAFAFIADSILVEVKSSIKASDQKVLKPIKGPFPIQFPLPWKKILRISLLVVFIILLYLLLKRRQKPDLIEEKIETKFQSALEIAMDRLSSISSLMDKSDKEFYIYLTHLLREFLENRWYLRALEMTTNDLAQNRTLIPVVKEEFEQLIAMLSKADLVKFAQNLVDRDDRAKDIEWVKKFVQNYS